MKLKRCTCGAEAEVIASEGMCGEAGFDVRAGCGNLVWVPGTKARAISAWNRVDRFYDCPKAGGAVPLIEAAKKARLELARAGIFLTAKARP